MRPVRTDVLTGGGPNAVTDEIAGDIRACRLGRIRSNATKLSKPLRQRHQRSCHATAKTLNSLPVRVEIPVLALNFTEFWRSKGSANVKPARVFDCSLSPLMPFTVVRAPVKKVPSSETQTPDSKL
jgi:hypothetical protein